MAGRPLKLTPKVRESICLAIEQGATYEIACGYAGVSYSAFRNWILRGEAERSRIQGGALADPAEKPFLQLVDALDESHANVAISWLMVINQAARTDPRWAAWMLERRHPDGYMPSQRIDMSVSIRERAEKIAEQTGLSVDEVLAEADRIVAGAAT